MRLHGIDENHAGEVAELLAFFRSLQRQFDLSVVLVHHTRKNAAGGVAAGLGLRGSSDIHAFGDSNLYLRRTRDHVVLSSEHRAAPASPAVRLELVATDAATTHLEVVEEEPEGKRRDPEEQVLDLLSRRSGADARDASRRAWCPERAFGDGAGVARSSGPAPPHSSGLAACQLIL